MQYSYIGQIVKKLLEINHCFKKNASKGLLLKLIDKG